MTIGPFCIEHESVAAPREFVRGRPLSSSLERTILPVEPAFVRGVDTAALVAARVTPAGRDVRRRTASRSSVLGH